MTHPHEDDLVLHYYGELRGAEAGTLERHLRECATCRDSFERLEQVLRAVDAAPGPEPSEQFEQAVWSRLRPALRAAGPPRAERRSSFFALPPLPGWVYASGVAALLVIAFLSGALWRQTALQPDATTASGGAQQAATAPTPGAATDLRERLLLTVVGEHLERTEVVLIELLNAQGRGPVDITAEQARAEELAGENRLYRQTAAILGNQALVSLLDELDLILTEVAGGPSTLAASDLDSMRRRIEGQNLLFKVQIVSSSLRAQERDAQARRIRITS